MKERVQVKLLRALVQAGALRAAGETVSLRPDQVERLARVGVVAAPRPAAPGRGAPGSGKAGKRTITSGEGGPPRGAAV